MKKYRDADKCKKVASKKAIPSLKAERTKCKNRGCEKQIDTLIKKHQKYINECVGLPGFYPEPDPVKPRRKQTMDKIVEEYLQVLTERNDAAIEIAGVAGGIGEQISKMDFACRKKECGGPVGVKASKRVCINKCKLKAAMWGLSKIRGIKSVCNKAKTPLDKKLCMKEYSANISGLERSIAGLKAKV